MDQLRRHCAAELSELQQCGGLQQDLLAALNVTYPQQVPRQSHPKDTQLGHVWDLRQNASNSVYISTNAGRPEQGVQ